ncbi:MAG TPA: DUF2232 domain-containing protein [Pseudolabrys sp.]|nr:DUF2232 domain-containing protein [Pseudolabrys sp.]
MMQIAIVGIGAGAAAALLFASVTSGSWLSIPLFYLAPLPIMIAGLGWSHWAAMTAALAGALGLGAVFGTVFLLAFLAGAGFPAWWLGYLTMLARPVAAGNSTGHGAASFEWYPPGRLVVWAAALGILVVIVAIPNFGIDADSFHASLRDALNAVLRTNGTSGKAASSPERLIDFLVNAIPPAAAVLATITNLLNLWLAARVVKFSGRLARPWPQLSSMSFPPLMTAALAVAIALSFLDGMLGIVGGIVAASLLLAYGVLGFAVLHAITQGTSARPFVLSITYAGVLLLGWPMLALCLLGLVDTAIGLRGRVSAKRGPPARS